MATQRKIEFIYLSLFIYNGAFRQWPGYPVALKIVDVNFRNELEFTTDQSHRRAYNGFEKGNPSAWRLIADFSFDNWNRSTSSGLRQILQEHASAFERIFFQSTAGTLGSTTVVITGGVQTDDYYNGLTLYNQTRGEIRIVTDYLGATRTASLDANTAGWSSGDTIYLLIRPNMPTYFGISIDDNTANMVHCNLVGSSYGIIRQQLIGKQEIEAQFRSVLPMQFIPDSLRIA